jgi:acyl-CoA synthetase (NDP forming)
VRRESKFGDNFPPKVLAIVGVSRNEHMTVPGYTGSRLFRILREAGFHGRIYPVNPKADVIDGVKAYPTVTAIPERPDLVIVGTPSTTVPQVLEDCAVAEVPVVQILTAGFGETGEAEGKRLEAAILEIARRTGLQVIGPNCMGFQIPAIGMRMFEDAEVVPGPVAFVSQSGGHAQLFLMQGPHLGIGFSKVISYGNALVMDAIDFLEYLAADDETRIICMYLEGVRKAGRELMQLVRQTNAKKPVILWKGGLTYSGARAASSHTGSLTGDRQVWDAFFKQTGAIRVGSIDEMSEVSMALLHMRPAAGRRVAVVGAGGGDSVATGDICAEEGLEMPPISPHTRAALLEFVSLVNQGVSNPLDIPSVFADRSRLARTLELLSSDPLIDTVILQVFTGFFTMIWGGRMPEFTECILGGTRHNPERNPIVLAVTDDRKIEPPDKYVRELVRAGIPAYASLRGACRAVSRVASYYEFVGA